MGDRINILYVDDERMNLQLFEAILDKKYKVFTAISGVDGLSILNDNPPIKIIFSDMKMPEMDGIEFITIAREKYPEKKFVILTGYEITDDIQDALSEGLIEKYIKKPFKINEIEKLIDIIVDLLKQ